MARILTAVLVVAIFLACGFADAETTDATPSTGPSLAESTAWLTSALPTDDYNVDLVHGEDEEQLVENTFDGCVWNIQRGEWRSYFPQAAKVNDSIADVDMLRFEPRAGLKFASRPMTATEASDFKRTAVDKFKQTRPPNTWDTWLSFLHGSFTGHVDSIDMSLVRLDSFAIVQNVEQSVYRIIVGTNRDYGFVAIKSLDHMEVQRYYAALRHVAELCGAKNDPF